MSDSGSNLLHCDCGCSSLIPTHTHNNPNHSHSHYSSPSSSPHQLRNALCSSGSSAAASPSTRTGVKVGLVLPSPSKEQAGLQHSSFAVGGRAALAHTTAESSVDKEGDLTTTSGSSLVPLPGNKVGIGCSGRSGDGGGGGADNNTNHLNSKSTQSGRTSRTSPPGSSVSNNLAPSAPPSSSSQLGFCSYCASKMFSCRVLTGLLLVMCIILSIIIPVQLIPTTSTSSSEYPPHEGNDYDGGSNGNGHHHHHHHSHSAGEEDGSDNIIMLDDQPLSLMSEMKSEIMNLVEPFDLHSQAVTNPDTDDTTGTGTEPGGGAAANGGTTTESGGGDDDSNKIGGDDDDNGNDNEVGHGANGDGAGGTSESGSETSEGKASSEGGDADGDGDKDDESQGEETAGEGGETTDSTTGNASSENGSSSSEGGGTCSMKAVLDKIEGLMDAIKNIDLSIDKMETLVQSTMIDERVYKCLTAIGNGNQTQAQKYWKQILRYLPTPQKQASILNQLIRDAYGGSEDQILPVIQFISHTSHYYGYYTLFNELSKHNHLYRNTAIFTLGHHIKKSCGRESPIYKSMPSAVQSVFSDFFTLQNKHNKGYLYYAKRCVAKHYFHCLDVLTKRIDPYALDGLAEEERKRYHWKLNATDSSVTKFFILNHDKYWTYRLQDLNNSPRFKMEEAGSNAEVELAHFQLKLHTDDELLIQVRDSEDYLEEEDFKSDKAEVRLHSFHQADGIPDSPRMFWLANPVASASSSSTDDDDEVDEPDSCNIDLASVSPPNGNGNGGRK